MDKKKAHKIASHVAASYVSRELDRVWLDRLMTTKVGKKLKALSRTEQRAFELIAYLSSAYVVYREPDPTALRSFLNSVLSDIPPELAKRMMSEDKPPDPQTALLLLEHLDDIELKTISEDKTEENNIYSENSLAVKLRKKIDMSRKSMVQNRKIIGRHSDN
ncbi:hypothetical protein [Sulfitobacter dubius]|uniref:hypothetical protein n=1 Tax=Sulfitobacter dubius TaxID=218673 RepID=UPI0022AFD40E|nr:hypothetical protein [Sulfitobacter dubius]MCZ4368681.1 hypothetical protein [Sulfitobacter dubius]